MTRSRMRDLFVQHWPRLALILACWVLLRLGFVASALLLKEVFDELTGGRTGLSLWLLLAVLAGTHLARTFLWFDVIMGRLEVWYSERIMVQLRLNVLAGLFRRPAATTADRPVGDVVDRFDRDAAELRIVPLWTASVASRVLNMVPLLGIMLSVSAPVTVGVVLPFVVVLGVARMMAGRVAAQRAESRSAAAEVGAVIGESMRAAGTLRALGHQEHAVSRLRSLGRHRERVSVREQVFGAVQSSVYLLATNLSAGLIMVLAARSMAAGELTVGDMTLMVALSSTLGDLVFFVGISMRKWRQARVSLDRLSALVPDHSVTAPARTWLRTPPPEPAPVPGRAEPLESLRVKGLSCRYASGGGVDGLDLELEPGALTVLTGAVGTGKTTALRGILGLLPRQSGAVLWNGAEVDPASFLVAPRIGYVPQVPHLFTGTVAENIRLGAGGDIGHAVGVSVLSADLDALPERADTLIGVGGRRLSGGQAQRVALARAIQRRPRLLVLDDVDSALDAVTARELWDRLLGDGGYTVLAVTHNPYALSRAGRVITLG
ncbi:ABC transporter ATP-binding protein [Phytomonospora sp. NPDC050363]|uniref:ABC transporter ATP-binding protein n=1 Tax=Phytomonospora sp. NPDC050363 TaxID=3155642 RepID=UPI0033CFB880